MRVELAGAVLIVVLLGYVLASIGRAARARWFLVRLWRFLSGEAHHGHPITDAGWFRHGERALTRTGHATRFWHLPRWKRASIRTTSSVAVTAAFFGLLAAPQVTVACLLAFFTVSLALIVWLVTRRVLGMRRRRTWLHPLHLAAHELAGIPRAHRAESWIKAELDDGGAVRRATLALPPGWPADEKDKGRLVAIASAKLGIEAPEPAWRSAGPAPQLCLTHSEPPPNRVEYGEVASAVERARPDEMICGLGKKRKLIKASMVLDSPHWAINMGTGGGKSSLAAFWLMQRLRLGAVAMVLDSKWFSHPWLFKDEDGEYSQLPNVAYLSSPEQLHDGLCWLGGELDRRNQVAKRAVTASGKLRGSVGPELIILAEELNFATPKLKELWAENRERDQPKKSPALTALGAVSFAGRAVRMHLFLIGQMITAEVTGSRDSSVKENVGVTAIARYGAPGWNTAIGRDVPMPPSPSVLGRVQLVAAKGVQETQTPAPDFLLYRKLATSGVLTPCPAGMPGAPRVPGRRELAEPAPGLPVVAGTSPVLGHPGSHRVILSEAAGKIVPQSLVALRKASQPKRRERYGFPDPVGYRGTAAEYDAADLVSWAAEQR